MAQPTSEVKVISIKAWVHFQYCSSLLAGAPPPSLWGILPLGVDLGLTCYPSPPSLLTHLHLVSLSFPEALSARDPRDHTRMGLRTQ